MAKVPDAPDVPVDDAGGRLLGHGPNARGLVNGIPMGEAQQDVDLSLSQQYKFRPGAASKLRAATKRALGRR